MQKYEREIVELLEKLESEEVEAPPRPIRRDRPPQLPRRRRRSVLSSLRSTIANSAPNPGQLMAIGLGIILLVWLLPLPAVVQQWLRMAGVLLFLGAIVIGLFNNNRMGRRDRKTWRGRPVEPEGPSWDEIKGRMGDSARDFRDRFRRRRY